MKEIVLITGANGMVAAHTARMLMFNGKYEIRFLTREPRQVNDYKWDIANKSIDEKALEGVDYIIHLAGSKLNDGTPLTEERQKLVWDTRIGASELLLEKLKSKSQKLKAFISASAMGYYSFSDRTLAIDETGNKGSDFSAILSVGWEKAADQFKIQGVAERVVKLRISFVLGKEGGIFPNLRKRVVTHPQQASNINGSSYFPWVHADDMGGMFAFAVENNELDGVFNTTAPEVTTREAILKLMYYLNEQDNTSFNLLDTSYNGQHLTSAKIIKAGYQFKFPDIKSALKDLMKD